MRAIIALAALGSISATNLAWAQAPGPARTPDDYVKAAQEAPCDNGEARDQDGLCPQAREQRGFNLGAPPRRRHHARPIEAGSAHPSSTAGPGAPAEAQAPSALDDLRITFVLGSSAITPEGRAEAQSFATALLTPALIRRRFEIAGHTDASGSSKTNLALSQARADAVVALLVAQGVDRSRLESKGYGSTRLAVPASPMASANRRVEAHSLN